MNGITILAQEEVLIEDFNNVAFIITVILSSILAGFLFDKLVDLEFFVGCLIGVGIGVFLGIGIGFITAPKNTETHYKITIDETVSMSEFYSKYEVVEQEGKIFTIKERKWKQNLLLMIKRLK